MTRGDALPHLNVVVTDAFGFAALPDNGKSGWSFAGVIERPEPITFAYQLSESGECKSQGAQLDDLKGGDEVSVKLYLTKKQTKRRKELDVWEQVKPIDYRLKVLPGTRPFKLTLTTEADELNPTTEATFLLGKTSKSKPMKLNAYAGQAAATVRFRLFTEGGEELQLTSELMGTFEFDWGLDEANDAVIKSGALPPLAALRSVSDDPKRYNFKIFVKQQIIHACVVVAAVPGSPTTLKANFLSKSGYPANTVIKPLSDGLRVDLHDKHGNAIAMSRFQDVDIRLRSSRRDPIIIMEAEQRTIVDDSLVVTGFKFQCNPRTIPVCIELTPARSLFLKASTVVNIVPGQPTGLCFPSREEKYGDWDRSLRVINEHKLPASLVGRLVDSTGQFCDINALEQIPKLSIKLQTDRAKLQCFKPLSLVGNGYDFGKLRVKGAPGTYKMNFSLQYSDGLVPLLSETLDIVLANDKLKFHHATFPTLTEVANEVVAGEEMQALLLQLLNKDNEVIDAAKWRKGRAKAQLINNRTKSKLKLDCHVKAEGFIVSSKSPLRQSGESIVVVTLSVDGQEPKTYLHKFKVLASRPTQIVVKQSTHALSACNIVGGTVLLKSLKIALQDDFGNKSAAEVGSLPLNVTVLEADGPELELHDEPYSVTGSETCLPTIALKAGTKAPNGKYTLVIAPEDVSNIKPLKIKFTFSDNAELNDKLRHLKQKIKNVESIAFASSSIINQVETELAELDDEKRRLHIKQEELIHKHGESISSDAGPSVVWKDLERMIKLQTRMRQELREKQSVPAARKMRPCPVEPAEGILGTFGSMLAVTDQPLQELVSWTLRKDLGLIIVRSQRAVQACQIAGARVLALDSISDEPVQPQHSFSLAEQHDGKSILGYLLPTKHDDECKQALQQLYGRTFIFPNVKQGYLYRRAIKEYNMKAEPSQRLLYPTIMTVDGTCIEPSGVMISEMPEAACTYPMLPFQDKSMEAELALDALADGIELAQQLLDIAKQMMATEQKKCTNEYVQAKSEYDRAQAEKDRLLSGNHKSIPLCRDRQHAPRLQTMSTEVQCYLNSMIIMV
eukprot:m.3931 g.3931  ORF g.3931 m.3931 type:complete len:1071 (+) comp6623_c0_seq1:416-3628(+)